MIVSRQLLTVFYIFTTLIACMEMARASTMFGDMDVARSPGAEALKKTFRLAQKKVFKYEVPKATRSAPAPAPSFTPQTVTRSAPTIRNTAPTTRRAPSTRSVPSFSGGGGGGGGVTVQVGPFGLTLGTGGGGGGSCEGCRESCYARLHGTKQFSPCMKGCWKKYCRR